MIKIEDYAGRITQDVYSTVAALSSFIRSDDSGLSRLANLEMWVDKVRSTHEEWLTSVVASLDDPQSSTEVGFNGRVYRCVSALNTLLMATASTARIRLGFGWGEHLISDSDPINVPAADLTHLPESAMPVLLASLVEEVMDSLIEVQQFFPGSRDYTSGLDASLTQICESFKITRVDRYGAEDARVDVVGSLIDCKRAAKELDITEDEVLLMAAERRILSVPTWAGEVRFPRFQFIDAQEQPAARIRPQVDFILRRSPTTFRGWPLAIFAKQMQTATVETVESELNIRGLLTSNVELSSGTDRFDTYVRRVRSCPVGKGEILYRVAQKDLTPFFFSRWPSQGPGRLAPSEAISAGRFDLDGNSHQGTMYLARCSKGAWAETLDRLPVVTLNSLTNRVIWELSPQSELSLADLSNASADMVASVNRRDTGKLATLLAPLFHGIEYVLKSGVNERGVAIFGKAGAHPPTVAHNVVWGVNAVRSGFSDDSLWEYLSARPKHLPVVLRIFPEES